MTDRIVMVYGCKCHRGQIYILNGDDRVVRVIRGDVGVGALIDTWGFKYKVLNDIHDLITAALT